MVLQSSLSNSELICSLCVIWQGEGLACYGMDNIYVLKGYAADGNGNVYDCRNGRQKTKPTPTRKD
eukprot:4390082-Amphidinium_carterae.1